MLNSKSLTRGLFMYFVHISSLVWDFSFGKNLSVTELSDSKLIDWIIQWNPDYYEILVERYSGKIFKYIYHYFNFSKSLANDMVQDVFVKVWNNLDKFDEKKNFQTWIYNIARNNCIDYLRKEKYNQNLWEIEVEWDDHFDQELQKDYKSKLVKRIVKGLVGEQKEVVLLYYFEWKTYDEISEIIERPRNTVGTLLSRAKKNIKNLIDSEPELKESITFDL